MELTQISHNTKNETFLRESEESNDRADAERGKTIPDLEEDRRWPLGDGILITTEISVNQKEKEPNR